MQNPAHGLRERQRERTLADLHRAAAELALEGGLAAATVEAVADRAGVSKRTFFNYYASKEDAVLGKIAPTVPEEALSEFLNEDSDLFGRSIRLIVAVIASTNAPGASMAERKDLVAKFPELADRANRQFAGAERLIETVLAERLRVLGAASTPSLTAGAGHGDPGGAESRANPQTDAGGVGHKNALEAAPEAADRASALLMLAGAVCRFAYQRNPGVLDGADDATLDHAIAVFRSAIQEIS